MRGKVKERVRLLIQCEPYVAFNKNVLVARYWQVFDGATDFFEVDKCTPSETITRVFREVMKEGIK